MAHGSNSSTIICLRNTLLKTIQNIFSISHFKNCCSYHLIISTGLYTSWIGYRGIQVVISSTKNTFVILIIFDTVCYRCKSIESDQRSVLFTNIRLFHIDIHLVIGTRSTSNILQIRSLRNYYTLRVTILSYISIRSIAFDILSTSSRLRNVSSKTLNAVCSSVSYSTILGLEWNTIILTLVNVTFFASYTNIGIWIRIINKTVLNYSLVHTCLIQSKVEKSILACFTLVDYILSLSFVFKTIFDFEIFGTNTWSFKRESSDTFGTFVLGFINETSLNNSLYTCIVIKIELLYTLSTC
jgi:hypothetical protein